MANLADRYQKRLNSAKKRGENSFRVRRKEGLSSAITQGTVDAIYEDENLKITVGENNVSVLQEAIRQSVAAALEEIGLVAEGAAKRLCPVDTGRLRNSITHAFMSDEEVAIGTNVEYSLYVHEPVTVNGKTRQGTPFLTQAVQNNAGRFQSIMRKHAQG